MENARMDNDDPIIEDIDSSNKYMNVGYTGDRQKYLLYDVLALAKNVNHTYEII